MDGPETGGSPQPKEESVRTDSLGDILAAGRDKALKQGEFGNETAAARAKKIAEREAALSASRDADAREKAKTVLKQGGKIYEGVNTEINELIGFNGEGSIIDILSTNPHETLIDALEKMVPSFKAPNRDNIPVPELRKALAIALKQSGIKNPDKIVVAQNQALQITTERGKLKLKIYTM